MATAGTAPTIIPQWISCRFTWTRWAQTDLSRSALARHPSHEDPCPTIAEALTLGGSKLAVDGVVLVGEHGNYPRNEKGQTKYPRYEFFKQIVEGLPRQRPQRSRSSTTSTSPGIGTGPRRCTTPPAS